MRTAFSHGQRPCFCHEAAGTNDIAALGGFGHHRVQYGSVVVIIGRIHDHERRIARCKSGEHRTMRTAAAVADELDRHGAERAAILRDGRQGVVILASGAVSSVGTLGGVW